MNNVWSWWLGFIMFTALVAGAHAQQPTVVDRVVAVVGGEPVLLSDLNAQVEFYALNNRVDPATPGLQERVLEVMVNEKLMLASAQEDTNVAVREDEVTNQLDALIAQRIQQVGSEKRLEEIYGMPISKMKREFRDETRKQLLVQTLQQMKFGEVQPSRREVEDFFRAFKDSLPPVPEQLELYHIYRIPKVSASTKDRTRARAQAVLDSLRAGGDFADFAKRYSEDRATAATGGDLGSWRRGQFVKEFEEAVFALQDGQLADLVETSRGFHVVQLMERRGEPVHARHILFRVGALEQTERDSTIAVLRALKDSVARGGANFSELAKRYSEDKESGPLGGYLGFYPVTQFDETLRNAVKSLNEGDISDPIEVTAGSTTGYQIVLLKRRIPEHTMNLRDDWKRIEQLATSYKRNNEYQKWIQQLRSEFYWDTRL